MTHGQVQDYINRVKTTIEEAQKELLEVKIIRENDPTEFSYVVNQLQELEGEFRSHLENASPAEKQELLEAKKYLQQTQEIMERGIHF
ncbi:DUF2524 family protein [Evansella tamaricis]|uniref:Uncharacterized protein n=1 Tax=Evansella tamaricis TaxID=2069301 RepID=A0ABS6JKK4_9BACI|nr:DUF2524 family protein [Evansella tamaricis]MBU9714178.1 hypothetical protein [Evansella tamaricis]